MIAHRRLLDKLWANFEQLANAVADRHGDIGLEWPKGCKYWKLPKVRAFLARHNCLDAVFHGCMFNLHSVAHVDKRILKPWRNSTTSHALYSVFYGRLRDKSHERAPYQGKDTKITEQYTHEMVKTLRVSWSKRAKQFSRQ